MLHSRTLVALLAAEAVSSTGTAMTFVALPWFILATGGSPGRMSVVLAAEVLPMAIFGIPSGSVIARLGARTTMLISDAARAPLIALVPVLYWTDRLSFPALLAIVFLIGVFTAPYIASQRTIVPELFGDDEKLVTKASALFGAAAHLPIVLGPALSGALVTWLGATEVLLVDGVTYLFAFVSVLLFVRGGRRVVEDAESRGVLAGIRYLMHDRLLGPMTLTVIVLDGAAGAIAVAVPLVAFTRYGQDAHVAGWLFTSFGIGAIVGSGLAMKLVDMFQPLLVACVAMVLATLPFWLIAFPVPWLVACGAIVLTGLCLPAVNAPTMGVITSRPPAALRAKVLTGVMTASALGSPLGRLAVGPVFRAHGNAGVWVMIAAGMTIGALLFVAAVLNGLRSGTADVVAMPPVAHG